MKTMSPPGYHHNGLVTTHALGHMMYGLYIGNKKNISDFTCGVKLDFHVLRGNIKLKNECNNL